MITFKEYYQVIEEGGAYGHMANIYEDTTLTFKELKDLIEGLLSGNIKAEFKEKTDGQALAVSMKNGKVIFARNKGQLKNGGANALTLKGVLETFKNRGDLTDAFSFAAKDIAKALLQLKPDVQEARFNDGHRWLNFEVIWPETTNVIPYDLRVLKLHNFIEYDDDGKAIDSDFDDFAVQIARDLESVNANIQNKFTIGTMPRVALKEIQDFSEKKEAYTNQLNSLQNKYGLNDASTLGDLYESHYREIISNAAKEYDYNPGGEVLNTLVNRWVHANKSTPIPAIKKSISDRGFADWVSNHDKTEHKLTFADVREPIKSMFINVATDVIGNMADFLAASPDASMQQIKRRLESVVRKVKETGDENLINQIDRELAYIEKAGGFDSIFPTEGLTFAMKRGDDDHPYVYKLTGTFAPVNQILGKEPGRFSENMANLKYTPQEGKPSFSKQYLSGILGPQ